MTLKGTISATFNGIEKHFRTIVFVSIYPASLMLIQLILSQLISIFGSNNFLLGNKNPLWMTGISMVLPLIGAFIAALWFTIIVRNLNRQIPRAIPSAIDLKNAVFVGLYVLLFFALTALLFFAFSRFFYYYAGVPAGTTGTVLIRWRDAGPMYVLMPFFFVLVAWFNSVAHVNLPRIAMGSRPNLFTEVIQYSKGIQTALTLRTVGLFFGMLMLTSMYSYFLLLPLIAVLATADHIPNPRDTAEIIAMQVSMTKATMILDPLFMIPTSFMVWAFSIFLFEASQRIETSAN